MKKTLLILTAIVSTLFFAAGLYAQAEMMPLAANQVSPAFLKAVNAAPPEASYFEEDSPAEKLGSGILNTATSWADIPARVVEVSAEENPVAGGTVGLAEGVFSAVARGVSGVYDATTCPFAPHNKPSMEPAYKTVDPQRDGLKVNFLAW